MRGVFLSQEAHSKSAMHKNISDWLLFVVIDEDNAYLLDVLKHPAKEEFSSYNFLKIAHSNGWLERMGFTHVSDYHIIRKVIIRSQTA